MYKILETLEAIDDLTNLTFYIYFEFNDIMAAERLIDAYSYQTGILQTFPTAYCSTDFYYRNYLIRKCPCGNTNIFYVIDDNRKQIIILRVLHVLKNWTDELLLQPNYHMSKKTE